MIIEIQRAGAHMSAMGHRVTLSQGGEPELKRRCLETLSRYDHPPDEVLFRRAVIPESAAPTLVPPASPRPEGKNPSPEQKKASGPGIATTVAKAKERAKGR